MPLEDFLQKKSKPSLSRRVSKKDKKKLATIPEPPVHTQEVLPFEPEDVEDEVPLVRKKSKAPKEKGVTIKEPLPPTKPKVVEVEGKRKDKVVEPPPKKQKLTHAPKLPLPETENRWKVDVN